MEMMDIRLPRGTTYILVIDTDAYAGNFERQIAGYTTGVFDEERGHGDSEARLAKEEYPEITRSLIAKSTTVSHEEYGQVSNTIRATPGRLNNGMGFGYNADDAQASADAKARAKKSAEEYQAPHIAQYERRLREQDFTNGWDKEGCERSIASAQAMIATAGDHVGYPCYESVAMFFREPLTPEEIAFVRERAVEFSQKKRQFGGGPFRVLDVYMVEAVRGPIQEKRLDI
jgi:hypothetical protein